MEKWMKTIEKEVDEGKKVVLVAGASSSGKSYSSEQLEKYLSASHRVFMLSADNFYKGVAQVVTEKTCLKSEFQCYWPLKNQISKILKQITCNYILQDKLKGEQKVSFEKAIQPYVQEKDRKAFINEIEYQIGNMNFDEPFAINFKLLAETINKLLQKQVVYLPAYSFHSSESELSEKVDGKDFDVIIVEGLYALREELLSQLDENICVKTAIDCDPKTLLSRKLHRDIGLKRSAFSEEMVLTSFLNVIIPAYEQFIYPTLKEAKYILNTSLTEQEVNDKMINKQVKFQTSKDIHFILQSLGAVKKDIHNQKDYFLEARGKLPQHMSISLRETDGKLEKLSFKFHRSIYSRNNEEYNMESFSKENQLTSNMLKCFEKGGFTVQDVVSKKRTLYELDGLTIRVDEVDNLGVFIELENKNIRLYKKYKEQLNMKDPIQKTYRDLTKEQVLWHIECEKKYKINNFSPLNHNVKEKQQILQYYFPFKDNKVQEILKDGLPNVNLEEYDVCRMRLVNQKTAVLTLKSKGQKSRKEFEREMSITFMQKMLPQAESVVKKTRYLLETELPVETIVDVYDDRNLQILEVEYDENKFSEKEIDQLVYKNFASAKDVTEDASYKNNNLAFPIEK